MGKGTNTFNTINSTTYNNYGQATNIRSLNTSGTAINRFNYTFTYNEATGNMLSRSITLGGYGLQQNSFHFGSSYHGSASYDPFDYVLAMGPPGEGMEIPSVQFGPPKMPGFTQKITPYAPDIAGTMGGAAAYHIGLQLEKPLMKSVATALSTPSWGRYGYNTVLNSHAFKYFTLQNVSSGLKYFGVAGGVYSVVKTTNDLTANYREGNSIGMAENGLDLVMTGVSFIPKVGWVIGGTYFLILKPIYHYYQKP